MIDLLRSLIPWEKSLPAKRTDISFSLESSPGSLSREKVKHAIANNLDALLSLGAFDEKGQLITNGEEFYEFLHLEKGNNTGDQLSFEQAGYSHLPSISVATGREREYDMLILDSPVKYFDCDRAMSVIKSFQSDDFNSAYLVDEQYRLLQRQHRLESYKYRGGLKTEKWGVNSIRVVTVGRPGRSAAFPGGNNGGLETGAAHYWFGDLIFPIISKEHIMAFDGAHKIEELPNGIVYVNLYEGTFNSNLPENQAKQEAFKDYLGLLQSK